MQCPFCYLPFDGEQSVLEDWKKIIDRLSAWNVSSITFGGGDPMRYRDFPKLLSYTADSVASVRFVQLDTNAILLREEHYSLLERSVDLVGLPLDGSNRSIHGAMRRDYRHFDLVMKHLESLAGRVPIKINTVVSAINVADLPVLMNLLSKYPIERWALYEFWPMEPAMDAAHRHKIDHAEYSRAAQAIREACDFTTVELGSIEDRRPCYFFVSQTGRAYTVDRDDANRYVELGSVFDSDVLDRWVAHGDPKRVEGRVASRMQKPLAQKRSTAGH